MEEIIYEFDRMRPTVRLEVRSKKNKNLGLDQAPFVNTPITAADILLDPSLKKYITTRNRVFWSKNT